MALRQGIALEESPDQLSDGCLREGGITQKGLGKLG